MRTSRIRHPFLSAIATLCCCSNVGVIHDEGGSSEVIAVVGKVVCANGTPAAGAIVITRPADYLADTSSVPMPGVFASTVTDSSGRFVIDSIDTGAYAIEVTDFRAGKDSSAALLTCTVTAADSLITLEHDTLRPISTIAGSLNSSGTPFVFVRGLDRVVRVGVDGKFLIRAIPQHWARLSILERSADTAILQTIAMQINAGTHVQFDSLDGGLDHVRDTLAVHTILARNNVASASAISVAEVAAGRIIGLNLVNKGLSVLPIDIGVLSKLQALRLDSNGLSSLPSTIASCRELKMIRCANNDFSAFPVALCTIDSLEVVDFTQNAIADTLPAAIGNLHRLRILYCGFNLLARLPSQIGSCAQIETLSVDQNRITSLPSEIGQLTALAKLNLHNNRIAALPPEIGNCSSLMYLSMHVNNLTGLPSTFGNLSSLRSLRANNNYLGDLPLSAVQRNSIATIFIRYNRLCNLPVETTAWLDAMDTGWRTTQDCSDP